jgi:abhydrolase domain-containing protein 6
MKAWLLQKMLASEHKRAGLQARHSNLSFGHVAYWEHAPSASLAAQSEAALLLHGACADHSSWLRFTQALGQDWHILAPDLPGHGESAASPEMDLGILAQTQRLIEWLAQLRLTRLHLVGNSMGGALALRLAYERPQWVRSLILIDTAGAESQPSELRRYVGQAHPHPRPHPMIEVNDLHDYQAMLSWGMAKKPWLPRFVQQLLLNQKRQRRLVERKLLEDLERDQDQRALLARIDVPTLILWGALDRVLHVTDAELLASNIKGSRKKIYADLGHVPMVEAPQRVAADCAEFWRSLAP